MYGTQLQIVVGIDSPCMRCCHGAMSGTSGKGKEITCGQQDVIAFYSRVSLEGSGQSKDASMQGCAGYCWQQSRQACRMCGAISELQGLQRTT